MPCDSLVLRWYRRKLKEQNSKPRMKDEIRRTKNETKTSWRSHTELSEVHPGLLACVSSLEFRPSFFIRGLEFRSSNLRFHTLPLQKSYPGNNPARCARRRMSTRNKSE